MNQFLDLKHTIHLLYALIPLHIRSRTSTIMSDMVGVVSGPALQNACEPARQQHPNDPINHIANEITKAPHWHKGKEEDIPWKLVALELADRLRRADASQAPPPNQDIQELKKSIKELQSAVKAIKPVQQPRAQVAMPSWANIAALHSTNPTPLRASDSTAMRKGREIMVRIDKEKDVQEAQTRSPAQILQEIERRTPTQRQQIASIRKLPSGDVALHAVSIEARLQLEKQPLWACGIAESARVIRRRFAVLAHGIRTTFNTQDQSAAITSLQNENKGLHEGLEILRVAWPKRVVESGKAFSSLIIEVASETMANRLMDYGIIESYREHDCELFEKGCRVLQCFNCFRFGHSARACKNKPFCHKCGKDHVAEQCKAQPERMHCPSCKEGKHKPWMRACPRWTKEKEIASERFKNKPFRFPEPKGNWASVPPSPPTSRPSFGSTSTSSFFAGGSSGLAMPGSSTSGSTGKRTLDAGASSAAKRGRGRGTKWVPLSSRSTLSFTPPPQGRPGASTQPAAANPPATQPQIAATQPAVQVPASQP